MDRNTRELWAKQDQHEGDRWRLFTAVAEAIDADKVLYPGCFVDIAPSFIFRSVTYVEIDHRATEFFADEEGVRQIISSHPGAPADPEPLFIQGDYTQNLGLPCQAFDLLVSLYAGFVSEHCTSYLRVGGALLVNPSHGDAAMASIDPSYQLTGVVLSRSGAYRVSTAKLDTYLVAKDPAEVTKERLHETGRGIAYTKSPYAYLFERVR